MAKKITYTLFLISYSLLLVCGTTSCASSKRGCPTNTASMGAERVLSGEKVEKKSKFKIKGMNY